MGSCTQSGCQDGAYAKGLCRRHYDQARPKNYAARNATPASIEARRRYARSEKGKAWVRKRADSERQKAAQRSYRRTPNGRFIEAKARAKYRGLEWAILKADYFQLIARPCHYCRGPLGSGGVGLDRVDSKQGYTLANAVPACRTCNVIKSDILTHDETEAVIALLLSLRGGKL
jgi:5-methylcytosine-specific restriction endonuclease McrA